LDHDALFRGGQVGPAAVGWFLVGWQLMVVAMLPGSFPALRRVAARRARVAPFLAGFGAVWTAFGWAALSLDSAVHRTVDQYAWLGARPYLVAAGLLVAVGLWQLAPLTSRCLAECRAWALAPGPDTSVRAGLANGARYGGFCLGCDGGLMLLMFAVGASLVWAAILALAMVLQHSDLAHRGAHGWIGAVILTAAAVVVAGSWA
jgi:predicted metal-binding membrane protein